MKFDVAVIGAGPAGAMVARLLGEQGYSTALIEEHEQPGNPVNCSGIIGVEAFRRFDLPRDHVLREIDAFRFYSPGGATLQYRHPEPLAYAVDRARFDIGMAARATSSGASLMTGSRVTSIKTDRAGVEIEINRGSSNLQSKFVVIATGAGSKLTQQAGLHAPQKYVLGAQVECETIPLEEVEVHLGRSVAPSNFAWMIPLQNGRAKIGLICESNAVEALRRFLSGPSLEGRILSREAPIQCSLLPLDAIPRSYADRTIVVGEAAGQMKTITCGGIYYGLLAAEIAADVLSSALQKDAWRASALAPYERRWHTLLRKELSTGLRLRSLFDRFNDSRIDALFDIARRDGLMALIREKANFDWHHDLVSSLLRHSLLRAFFQPTSFAKLFR